MTRKKFDALVWLEALKSFAHADCGYDSLAGYDARYAAECVACGAPKMIREYKRLVKAAAQA